VSSQSPKASVLDERLPDDYFDAQFLQYSPAAADGTTKQTCQLTAGIGVAAVKQIDCVIFDIGNVLVRWDPRNLYRRMGYTDVETTSILAEIGLVEVNHRVLDAGGAFYPTLEALVVRFPRHAEFITCVPHSLDRIARWRHQCERGHHAGTETQRRAHTCNKQLQS